LHSVYSFPKKPNNILIKHIFNIFAPYLFARNGINANFLNLSML